MGELIINGVVYPLSTGLTIPAITDSTVVIVREGLPTRTFVIREGDLISIPFERMIPYERATWLPQRRLIEQIKTRNHVVRLVHHPFMIKTFKDELMKLESRIIK